MALQSETRELFRKLEQSANRKLRHPEVVGALIEYAHANGMMEVFLEALFLAKFVTKSFGIMKRIGVDGEGYEKLSAESESNLMKASGLLRSLNEHLPEELGKMNDASFFSKTQESMGRFVVLLEDLSMLKNWTVDGGRLPEYRTGAKDA